LRRDWLIVSAMWAVLTVIGEVIVFTWSMLPDGYAREAEIVNDAYVLLLAFAVPVFTFMVSILAYSAFKFRSRGQPTDDGPPMTGSPRVITAWLVVTSGLTLAVLINPGFVGLADVRGEAAADMVVGVSAQRWTWDITYENGATTREELVLPVDTRIRFDVTATDILHSFWVPAFGVKIDAVPGRTTEMYVTTERTGDRVNDSNLRVQCAELCGSGHSVMAIPVRVVEQSEFDTWVQDLTTEDAAAAADEGS
jgi:cytochrome c oxidase subunit 2